MTLKKICGRHVTIVKKSWRYVGTSGTIQISIDFSYALIIPLLGKRVRPEQNILNPYWLKIVTLILCTTCMFPTLKKIRN